MGILNLVQFWRIFGIKMANDSKIRSSNKEVTNIYLNIYDLSPINAYLSWFGLGVFHSGIEVHGMEYGYGAHEYPTSGVFEVEPRLCPGFLFKQSIRIGTTTMCLSDFRVFIQDMASKYHGDSYNLISKNCNHFTDDVAVGLTGKNIPGWVNRLARLDFAWKYHGDPYNLISKNCNHFTDDVAVGLTEKNIHGWVNRLARLGSYFNCLLPDGIQVSQVKHVPAQNRNTCSDDDALSDSVLSSITDGSGDDEESDCHLISSPKRYSVSSDSISNSSSNYNANANSNSTNENCRDKSPRLAKDLM